MFAKSGYALHRLSLIRLISQIGLIASITACLAVHPARISAQTTSLSVSPAILETIVKPGINVDNTLTIINQTNIALPIKGYIRNFVPNEKIEGENTSAFDASAWFSLEPADFILQPREERKIKVSILAPKKVEPGGHYATVYFEPLIPAAAVAPGSSLSLARVGVLSFLIAPGDIKEKLEIVNFNAPWWQTFGPIKPNFELKNSGNLHSVPSGSLTVTDMFGREQAKLELPPVTLLPGSVRPLNIQWGGKFLLGRYSISGSIVYGADKTVLTLPSIKIWLIPWPILLLVIVLLTTSGHFVIVGRKRLQKAWLVLTGKSDIAPTETALPTPQEVKKHATPKQKKHPQSNGRRRRTRP